MEFCHYSVLLRETIEQLKIRPEGIYVDGTLGGAGHSSVIAGRLTTGHLVGIDQDLDALQAAKKRLEPWKDRVTLVHDNYEHMIPRMRELGYESADGILLDLGVSSFQLDARERGFSYMDEDAPLDIADGQNRRKNGKRHRQRVLPGGTLPGHSHLRRGAVSRTILRNILWRSGKNIRLIRRDS